MATRPITSTPAVPPMQKPDVSATVVSLGEARRVALLRRLWAEHDMGGSSRA